MNESQMKIDRLMARLHRGIERCDQVEQRVCQTEERFGKLNESVQTLSRLIDVTFLILISSEKEKLTWLQLPKTKNIDVENSIFEQFIYRLELYLNRTITDNDEKRAYIHALFLLQSLSIVSSRLFE
ncbi:unnamed protein product [Adineta ricciae]|uniref:Uncharacterized protein n=1 Tax=Adineta ricciae TaxID=249248 RepID=A0A814EHL1_ADIRI|nr:unnamed protein product [Adineta ricciae]